MIWLKFLNFKYQLINDKVTVKKVKKNNWCDGWYLIIRTKIFVSLIPYLIKTRGNTSSIIIIIIFTHVFPARVAGYKGFSKDINEKKYIDLHTKSLWTN